MESKEIINIENTDIFHVHTWRCGHAEEVPDEAYIKRAIELGATGIWFADHAPFPGDPFQNRMKMDQLPEYLKTLAELRDKYEHQIKVRIGLEIEYFPSWMDFYQMIPHDIELDFLLLGQHIYETESGQYNYSLSPEEKKASEFYGCGQAIVDGLNMFHFPVLAHPDRIFRRQKNIWTPIMKWMSQKIIDAAMQNGVILEKNLTSMQEKHLYRTEFWKLVPEDVKTIYGSDAHSLKELEDNWQMQKNLIAEAEGNKSWN